MKVIEKVKKKKESIIIFIKFYFLLLSGVLLGALVGLSIGKLIFSLTKVLTNPDYSIKDWINHRYPSYEATVYYLDFLIFLKPMSLVVGGIIGAYFSFKKNKSLIL